MTTCHGCNQSLEPLAAIRVYHGGCDPWGRMERLEKALQLFVDAHTWCCGSELGNDNPINVAAEAARAALAYRPVQMKGRE